MSLELFNRHELSIGQLIFILFEGFCSSILYKEILQEPTKHVITIVVGWGRQAKYLGDGRRETEGWRTQLR